MLVAAAAMAFVSCQKQEAFAPETSTQEVMLTFASEKPAFDDETKTEWTGETIQWSKGDKISVAYTVAGNWQNASGNASGDAKLYKSDALNASTPTAQFNVSTSFKGETEGAHVFYGVYPAPSSTDFNHAPVATLTVAPSQTPKADSFDSNGDLMIGVSNELSSRPAEGETISLKWERLVAHAVISLKNINGLTADEEIVNITLTAQDDANLVGQQEVNLITKKVVKDNARFNSISAGELDGGGVDVRYNPKSKSLKISGPTSVEFDEQCAATFSLKPLDNRFTASNRRRFAVVNISSQCEELKLGATPYVNFNGKWIKKTELRMANNANYTPKPLYHEMSANPKFTLCRVPGGVLQSTLNCDTKTKK